MQSVWNSCETSVKSLNDGAERLWVEPVRRNCHTKNRSGRRSNSIDKLNDDFVERRSGAAVGRTRSTKLSNEGRSRSTRLSTDEFPRFQRGCCSLLEYAIRREYIFSYVFAGESNQHHLTQSEGMHHSPFQVLFVVRYRIAFCRPSY